MRLPRTLVYAGLVCALVIGQIILWIDKRADNPQKRSEKSIGNEKLA